MPNRPDFAQLAPPYLEHRDLLFLFEHFPVPGTDPIQAAQQVMEHPSTLESLLESQFVFDAIRDQSTLWLDVSPRLFFNVLLRRCLSGDRSMIDRRAIHYLANLLGHFISADRVYRIQAGDADSYAYLADLVQAESDNDHQNFLVHSHIGNFALFLSGVQARWVEHRHRYRRRPISLDYYRNMGTSYFARAAGNRMAETFEIEDVLSHLSNRFEYFRTGLETLAERHLVH